jgi:hypothetical protein
MERDMATWYGKICEHTVWNGSSLHTKQPDKVYVLEIHTL